MFEDAVFVLMNECYRDSVADNFHLLSDLEGNRVEKIKNLSEAGLMEIRKPQGVAKGYGVAYEVRLTKLGISKYENCLSELDAKK